MQCLRRICCVCAGSLVLVSIVAAQPVQPLDRSEIELTGSWAAQASLGSWVGTAGTLGVLLQQSRGAVDAGGFTFSDLRLAFAGGSIQIVARAEQNPEIERRSQSSVVILDDGIVVPRSFENRQTTTMRSFDLGIALPFEMGARGVLSPLIGATYLDGHAMLSTACAAEGDAPSQCTFHRHEGQLGVVVGLRASWELGRSLAIVGDLISRWSPSETVYSFTYGASSTVGGAVVPLTGETRQTRSMFGGEAGVTWQAGPLIGLAAGWRYRDWSYDTGPGQIHGPFVRLSITI